jgi:hypothetical protein
MKEFKGFKCDHCGKLYQRKHACEKHENKFCNKHPNNLHQCWWCPYLSSKMVNHYLGEHFDGSEIWAEKRAFFCEKKQINLYCYKFDKHIKNYEPAQMDEDFTIERMPTEVNPCEDYKEYESTHNVDQSYIGTLDGLPF